MQIIPSLLTDNPQTFAASLDAIQGACNMVQIDIADGEFVSSVTINDPALVQKHAVSLLFELHLMCAHPCDILSQWHGIKQIKRVYIHVEIAGDVAHELALIRQHGWQAGIAIKPKTDIAEIEKYPTDIDAVLFLGVTPGGQGRPFQPEVLQKIIAFREKYPEVFTALDGGVNKETLPDIIQTGVDAVCPGSAIFSQGVPSKNILQLQTIVERLTKQVS